MNRENATSTATTARDADACNRSRTHEYGHREAGRSDRGDGLHPADPWSRLAHRQLAALR